MRDFHFFDENNGLAVSDGGVIWSTTNGGITWNSNNSGIGTVLRDIHFVNDELGFISVEGGYVLKTIDGGQNWSINNTPVVTNLRFIDFKDDQTGITVGNDGLIFITLNGGTDWIQVPSGYTDEILFSVDVVESTVFICGENGLVLKSDQVFRDTPIVELKVYLQGPYNPGLGAMDDDLRSNSDMPLTEPYTDLGFIHFGGGGGEEVQQSVLDVSGSDAIVDWVFFELRDKTNINAVAATRSALLQRDGDVVDVDGISPVLFSDLEVDDYYIVVKHRNHLGAMSATPIALHNPPTIVDFTIELNNIYGGANGIALMDNGRLALYSGDFNLNGQIQNTDFAEMILNIGTSGYRQGDFDLNGQVQNVDLQLKLMPNIGRGQAY